MAVEDVDDKPSFGLKHCTLRRLSEQGSSSASYSGRNFPASNNRNGRHELHRENVPSNTATSFPWSLGVQVLGILEILNITTPAMIHLDKIVPVVLHVYNALKTVLPGFKNIAIFEAITTALQSDIFPHGRPPKAKYLNTFQNYAENSQANPDGYPNAIEARIERRRPSIIQQCPMPNQEILLRDQGENSLLDLIRKASSEKADLPSTSEWSVIHIMEQIRSVADREFNDAVPRARINFIAIFLACAELLMIFDKSRDLQLNVEQASWMVGKVEKILDDLDKARKPDSDGLVTALVGAFKTFEKRKAQEILWEKL
ncbi:hypothetical protein BU23DRAFT_642294 [Bimuria novae-zelandiae CBS 107.79]|uniref:Uncharacterized protein n=1 Tax=Bimuria novae-zelandiae CBS 107.79 TaxID=1447943 RepID=A0A6A5VTY3_9PLEO|nr:hypothetical protein BU23DRAFT_642294 [Bimuria novae-zelandiae CBS 107.79]